MPPQQMLAASWAKVESEESVEKGEVEEGKEGR